MKVGSSSPSYGHKMKIPLPSPLDSVEAFIGRKAEADALKAKLARFRRLLNEGKECVGNSNIVMYYGAGGVGKTSLSLRLEQWVRRSLPLVNGWGPPPDTRVHATARIDLHGSGGSFDPLDLLLTLRYSLHAVRRTWGAFDLALSAYWAARFPNQPIPRTSTQPDLQEPISEAIGQVVAAILDFNAVPASGLSSLAPRGLLWIANELRAKHELHRQLGLLEGFGDFLLECSTHPGPNNPRYDIVCKLAEYLAWELNTVSPSPLLVVFVDATERLFLDSRRTTEHQLNLLIGSLPNALFVLTGRDQLDWHRPDRADLHFFGAARWPDLEPDLPKDVSCQLKVPNLSEQERMSVLERARSDDDLPIPDDVLREIAVTSAGLPLYLRLTRDVAKSIRDAGSRPVTLEDVARSLEALVARVLEDVSLEEQRFIRAACLFHTFDAEFIARVANVDMAVANRAVTRSLIDPTNGETKFRVHDEIRGAIRGALPRRLPGWTIRDWEAAASRALVEAHRQHDAAKARSDHLGALQAISMAIVLVSEHAVLPEPATGNYADWLSEAIVFAPSIYGLAQLIPPSSSTEYGSLCIDFITAEGGGLNLHERVMLSRRVFDSSHPLALPAGRHLAYALRNHSQWDDSLDVIHELIDRRPSDLHIRQLAATLCVARRFAQALDEVQRTGVSDTVTAQVEFAHGKPTRYFEEVSKKIATLRSQRRVREELEFRSLYLMRRAFVTGVSIEEVEALKLEAETAGHAEALRTAMIAETLVVTMDSQESRQQLDRIREMGGTLVDHRYALGECVDAVRKGDERRLAALIERIEGRSEARGSSWILNEQILAHTGHCLTAMDTQWVEPEAIVRERWAGHISSFFARTNGIGSSQSLD